MNDYVYLECVKDNRKLRVRIISPGYSKIANCQFPSAIREEGLNYRVPRKYIKFGAGSAGTFFYRVLKKNFIEVVDNATALAGIGVNVLNGVTIYEEEDCTVCYSVKPEIVFIPCGHYCLCTDCDQQLEYRKCPCCMNPIEMSIPSDQIK